MDSLHDLITIAGGYCTIDYDKGRLIDPWRLTFASNGRYVHGRGESLDIAARDLVDTWLLWRRNGG